MKRKVLPTDTKTLQEDDDQNETDVVFFLCVIGYTGFISGVNTIYTAEDYNDVGKFVLIMSNLFSIFPIVQGQGIWMKLLVFATAMSSIMWHWVEIGMKLPENHYNIFYRQVFIHHDYRILLYAMVAYTISESGTRRLSSTPVGCTKRNCRVRAV